MTATLILTSLIWSTFVGAVFSTIGAAGGILTSFGLITLFGVADPNSVKPMTQLVVLVSALTFVPGYLRRAAIVVPLGLLLGAGGLIGAYVGSSLSSHYLSDMKTFRPLFGILTLGIAAQIGWKLFRNRYAPKDPQAQPAPGSARINQTALSLRNIAFRYGTTAHQIPTWSPLVAGAIISLTAALFGVGGGFLLVPYMSILLGLPMHIIPATAAIAIFMSLAVSISNFIALGAPIDLSLLVPLSLGTIAGAIAGPWINRSMKNSWLQATLGIIVLGIGLKYILA